MNTILGPLPFLRRLQVNKVWFFDRVKLRAACLKMLMRKSLVPEPPANMTVLGAIGMTKKSRVNLHRLSHVVLGLHYMGFIVPHARYQNEERSSPRHSSSD